MSALANHHVKMYLVLCRGSLSCWNWFGPGCLLPVKGSFTATCKYVFPNLLQQIEEDFHMGVIVRYWHAYNFILWLISVNLALCSLSFSTSVACMQLLNKIVYVVSFVGNNGTFINGYKAMVMDVEFLYHLIYVFTCTLGLFVHELFYSLMVNISS